METAPEIRSRVNSDNNTSQPNSDAERRRCNGVSRARRRGLITLAATWPHTGRRLNELSSGDREIRHALSLRRGVEEGRNGTPESRCGSSREINTAAF